MTKMPLFTLLFSATLATQAQAMEKLGREIPEELSHLNSSAPALQEATSVVERQAAREKRDRERAERKASATA